MGEVRATKMQSLWIVLLLVRNDSNRNVILLGIQKSTFASYCRLQKLQIHQIYFTSLKILADKVIIIKD